MKETIKCGAKRLFVIKSITGPPSSWIKTVGVEVNNLLNKVQIENCWLPNLLLIYFQKFFYLAQMRFFIFFFKVSITENWIVLKLKEIKSLATSKNKNN